MELPVIKNMSSIAHSPLRYDALRILEEGYMAILTDVVIREEIEMIDDTICIKDQNICLSDYDRVFYVAVGKCAVDASVTLEKILANRITDGVVLDVKSGIFQRFRSFVGTHPFPSQANISATEEIKKMLTDLTDRDLVFVVVSGGGSSLLCLPHETNCEALEYLTQKLWQQSADIVEVNTLRKHSSDIQGGQLAQLAYPATVVSFIISDVPGDNIANVASGPTVLDVTTVADAKKILSKYGLDNDERIAAIPLHETPKDEKYFERVLNILLATNKRALEAMHAMASVLGYRPEIIDTNLKGEASEIGRKIATMNMSSRSCYIFGGETTVKADHYGSGGRNQELALAACEVIENNRVLIAAASDGWDNSEVAGAIADSTVRERAIAMNVPISSYLHEHDSYHFWEKLGDVLRTGKTGTNVADFCIILSN